MKGIVITALAAGAISASAGDKVHPGALTHAYARCTVCTPSRASFMSGMYPSTIRNCMNGNDRFSEAAPLISNYLRDAGYFCGLVGKLHLAAFHRREEPRPADDGFEHFVIGDGVQKNFDALAFAVDLGSRRVSVA